MKPKVGEVYNIRHSRKGSFVAKVLSLSDEWCDVEIIAGTARNMARFTPNDGPGDVVTLRLSHCYFAHASQHQPEPKP